MYVILKVRKCNSSIVNVLGYAATLHDAQNVVDDLNACLNTAKNFCIIYQKIEQLTK